MFKALLGAAHDADIFHGHLLWMMPTIYPSLVKALRPGKCQVVMSPRGTLDPWDFNNHKLQKRVVWLAGQKLNLVRSACLHATAPMERDHFRALGLRAPIATIPNGVDIPDLTRFPKVDSDRRRLLFFARIHPKKGVEILIRAWRNIQDSVPDWDLQIAGNPYRSHLEDMQLLARRINAQRIIFSCPVPSENEKWHIYRNADLYVLPTRGDNWGISVADALSFAVPAIVSKEAPWSGLHTHACGWWVDLSVDAFTDAMRSALQLEPHILRAMGRRGREWMIRDFSWDTVGRKMAATYHWISSGGHRPEWISL